MDAAGAARIPSAQEPGGARRWRGRARAARRGAGGATALDKFRGRGDGAASGPTPERGPSERTEIVVLLFLSVFFLSWHPA